MVSDEYLLRFGGIARLYGQAALLRLAEAHFTVIGLGGVGSWAAEALARSGVGQLTLMDVDEVCITNTNRQSQALASNIGQSKLTLLQQRLLDINPELRVNAVADFLDLDNITGYIVPAMHVVVDAIDSTHIKAGLVAYCSARKIRLITVGSSGGKQLPQAVTVADLGKTEGDPMLAKLRTQLYRHYGFARDAQRKFRIDAVYSPEQMVYPKPDGSVCMTKQVLQQGIKLDCTGGFGSSMMVTASFGMAAAAQAVKRYLNV